jgi:predicted AlkP superfamily pyrophosphatase or phosphodiesterase
LTQDRRVQFINTQLQQGGFDSLEELADDMFLDVDDIKRKRKQYGYVFVPSINKFEHCVGTAST